MAERDTQEREDGAESPPSSSSRGRPRRTLRFTRQGRFYVLVTLGVGAAALNTGNNLLYLVLGLLLSLVILSGVLSDLVLFYVEPRRSLPARAHAGTPFLVEITLRNHKRWLPSFSIEVEDVAPTVPSDRRCYFLRVEPDGTRSAVYRRTVEDRGILRFERIVLRTSYPFGLFEKSLSFDAPEDLVIYPELEPDRAGLSSASRQEEGEARAQMGAGIEPISLREYQSGDEARSVHARRSASLGRLVVKENARHRNATVTLRLADLVDPALGEAELLRRAERFEQEIKRAAWVATMGHGRRADVEIEGDSGRRARASALGPLDPVLRFLAMVQPVSEQAPTREGRSLEGPADA